MLFFSFVDVCVCMNEVLYGECVYVCVYVRVCVHMCVVLWAWMCCTCRMLWESKREREREGKERRRRRERYMRTGSAVNTLRLNVYCLPKNNRFASYTVFTEPSSICSQKV